MRNHFYTHHLKLHGYKEGITEWKKRPDGTWDSHSIVTRLRTGEWVWEDFGWDTVEWTEEKMRSSWAQSEERIIPDAEAAMIFMEIEEAHLG